MVILIEIISEHESRCDFRAACSPISDGNKHQSGSDVFPSSFYTLSSARAICTHSRSHYRLKSGVPCTITIQFAHGGSIYCHPPSPCAPQADKILTTLCTICLSEIVICPSGNIRSRLIAQFVSLVIWIGLGRLLSVMYVCGESIQG